MKTKFLLVLTLIIFCSLSSFTTPNDSQIIKNEPQDEFLLTAIYDGYEDYV